MNAGMEHRKRYYERLRYCNEFEKWLEREPKMFRVIAWHKWKKQRPLPKGDTQ